MGSLFDSAHAHLVCGIGLSLRVWGGGWVQKISVQPMHWTRARAPESSGGFCSTASRGEACSFIGWAAGPCHTLSWADLVGKDLPVGWGICFKWRARVT